MRCHGEREQCARRHHWRRAGADSPSPTTCANSNSIAGHDFVIFDRGPDAGGAWQYRWPALRLGSAHRVNDLPGMGALGLSFDDADRSRPARDVVADYYRRYEAALRPPGGAPGDRHVRLQPGGRPRGRDDLAGPRRGRTRARRSGGRNASGTWGVAVRAVPPGRRPIRRAAAAHVRRMSPRPSCSRARTRGRRRRWHLARSASCSSSRARRELTWVARRPIDLARRAPSSTSRGHRRRSPCRMRRRAPGARCRAS